MDRMLYLEDLGFSDSSDDGEGEEHPSDGLEKARTS